MGYSINSHWKELNLQNKWNLYSLDQNKLEEDNRKVTITCDNHNSEMRSKIQERKLKENNLMYKSKEVYKPDTKRTSRVLVCMYDNWGKEFDRTRNLIIHSRVHTKVKPHICPHCDRGFSQKCNLKKHIDLHKSGTYNQKVLNKVVNLL